MTVLAVGGTSIALLSQVRDGLSVNLYRALLLGTAWDHAADALLLLLGLVLAWAGWSVRRDLPAIVRIAWVGVGTAVASGLSEGLKLVVDEERPCRAVLELAGCPPAGDWSFPSNHATLAAGIAVGVAMLRPRLAAVALPLGLLVALTRVVAGVHYPHDVLAGAALGAAVVAAGVLLLGKQPGLVRDHRRGGPITDAELGQDGADVRFHRSLDHPRRRAIWPLVRPAARNASTSRSRGVSAAPPATARTPAISSSGSPDLTRKPAAPSFNARRMLSSSPKVVSITTPVAGTVRRISAAARSPSTRGMRMSRTATSGRCRWASSTACRPSAAAADHRLVVGDEDADHAAITRLEMRRPAAKQSR